MHETIRSHLERLRAETLSTQPKSAEPVRDGNEMADEDVQPLTEMSQSIASSRNALSAVQLRDIEAALEKLDLSPEDFGLCEECDEPIGERRLARLPWAKYCIRCQSARESGGSLTRKNLTDYR